MPTSRKAPGARTFAPSGQGIYTLYARATDRVGHTGAEKGVTVYVDDTAPTVTLGRVLTCGWTRPCPATKPNTWVVALSGTVSDPDIATGVKGSGVPADGVRVTLRDADGKPLGDAGQIATVSCERHVVAGLRDSAGQAGRMLRGDGRGGGRRSPASPTWTRTR